MTHPDSGDEQSLEQILREPRSRRDFLAWASKIGFGGVSFLAAGAILDACGGSSKASKKPATTSGAGFVGSGDTLKVGVIAPLSGIGAFVGRIVNTSLDAAVQQINSTGGIGGRKVEVIKRDTQIDASAGVKAYQEFAGNPDVIGVLWAGGAGLSESKGQIARDGMPVIAVFNDLWSEHQLYPEGPERSIFQLVMPDRMAFDLIARYAKDDRGYSRVALLQDALLYPNVKTYFTDAARKHGLSVAGTETYQLNDSAFGPQLNRLRGGRSEALLIWGLAGDTAGIVKQIDRLGAGYVDTPTAKGSAWHPQIIGSPGGTGEHTWADLAGDAAKPGTLTAWHIGGLVALPSFPVRDWMKKFLGKNPTGGEESPANGLFYLLNAVKVAGSTDRQKMVTAIETMGPVKFASAVPYGFTKDRHLALTDDDLIMVTLERSAGPAATDPPYELGTEWSAVFPAGYVGPTHLVRPTIAANKRAHPDVIEEIVRLGYGTQCTKHSDGSLGTECKIH